MLALVVALGCGGAKTRVVGAGEEPSVALLEPGAEPRRRVRHAWNAPGSERVEMTLKLRMETEFTNTVLETGHERADLPTIVMVARFTSPGPTAAGDTVVTAELDEIRVLDDVVDPELRKRVAVQAERLRRWKATWRVTPAGSVSDLAFEQADAQLSGFVDAIGDTSVVFPDTEIGVGAAWQAVSRWSRSGAVWNRTTTYRLRALDDSTATVTAETVMTAPPQVLRVEPNATTRVTSGSSTAVSEWIIPLDGLVATGDSQTSSEIDFSIVRGHLRILSKVRTEMLSSSKPLPAE